MAVSRLHRYLSAKSAYFQRSKKMLFSQLMKGALAGCVATVPMTAVMLTLAAFVPEQEADPIPPRQVTREITSRAGLWQQADKEERAGLTTLAHFGFGAAAGALYGPFAGSVPAPPLLSGAAYGLLVWAANYAGWLPALDIVRPPSQKPDSQNAQLILSHLVWGASLGVLVDAMTS
jgi:uncharacterized membrane protein YagU involved in acid resistance